MIEKTAKRNNRENCGGVDESLNVRSNGGREQGTNKVIIHNGDLRRRRLRSSLFKTDLSSSDLHRPPCPSPHYETFSLDFLFLNFSPCR